MSEKRDDSYNHVLKYTSLFGGVQVLSILIGSPAPMALKISFTPKKPDEKAAGIVRKNNVLIKTSKLSFIITIQPKFVS